MSAGDPRPGRWPWRPSPEIDLSAPQHHIGLVPGQMPGAVILPGDPKRTELIAGHFDSPELIADQREFVTRAGTYKGVGVATTSTGIGCPSTAIAVEELVNVGADRLIRLGTCGTLREDLVPGTLIVPSGAVRGDGTSAQYAPVEYPAVPDLELSAALIAAANAAGLPVATGIIRSHDAFYMESPWAHPGLQERIDRWADLGVVAVENESSALYVVAGLRGARAATCLIAAGNARADEEGADEEIRAAVDRATGVVLEAILATEGLPPLDGWRR